MPKQVDKFSFLFLFLSLSFFLSFFLSFYFLSICLFFLCFSVLSDFIYRLQFFFLFFLAQLSQRLIGERILYPCSGVRRRRRRCCCCRRPQFSNIFSSENAWPIKAKFYAELSCEGGTKVYINGPGHMTKMAAMPIYGKNLKKSSLPEPAGRFSRNLVCSIGDSCPS